MAKLSNINGKFAVEDTGAIRFSDQTGTTGQILKSNGNSAPTWVDPNTVGTGPWLPLAGGIVSGPTTFQSTLTVGGTLTVNGSGGSVFNSTATTNHIIAAYRASNGNNVATFRTTDSGYIFRIHAQNAGTIYVQNDDGSNYLKIADSGSNEVSGNTTFTGTVTTTDVYGASSLRVAALGGILYLDSGSSSSIILRTNGTTERVRIESGGNIRVNFNQSGSYGNLYFQDVDNGASMFYLQPAVYKGSAPYNTNYINAANSTNIGFITGGSERMRITSDGDVFIGNSSVTTANTAIFLNKSGIITNVLANSGGTTDLMQFYQQNGGGIGTISRNASGICLNGNGQTNQLVAADNGNVGIGTDSPTDYYADKLVVNCSGSEDGITIVNGAYIMFADGSTGDDRYRGQISYAHSIDAMLFATDAQERMRIDSVGTIDIKGQNNNVNGMAAIIARLGSNCNNTTSYAFIAETGNANKCFIHGNGNIVNSNNSYGQLSDKRLKENIKDATPKLDDLMKVKVKNFNMIGDDSKQIGVIAQELEEIFPSMISENKGSNPDDETLYKGVKYSVFVPILVKAIQELEARIKILENK